MFRGKRRAVEGYVGLLGDILVVAKGVVGQNGLHSCLDMRGGLQGAEGTVG